jgi:hypothetical protein
MYAYTTIKPADITINQVAEHPAIIHTLALMTVNFFIFSHYIDSSSPPIK